MLPTLLDLWLEVVTGSRAWAARTMELKADKCPTGRTDIAGFYDLFEPTSEEQSLMYVRRPPGKDDVEARILFNEAEKRWEIGLVVGTGTFEVRAYLNSKAPLLETAYGQWRYLDSDHGQFVADEKNLMSLEPYQPKPAMSCSTYYDSDGSFLKHITPLIISSVMHGLHITRAPNARAVIIGLLEATLLAVKTEKRAFSKLPDSVPQKSTLPHLLWLLCRTYHSGVAVWRDLFLLEEAKIPMLMVGLDHDPYDLDGTPSPAPSLILFSHPFYRFRILYS